MVCLKIFIKVITALAVITCLWSCGSDDARVIDYIQVSEPVAEAVQIRLKHTDSGYIKLKVEGRKMLDYSNNPFPYREFPEGIKVTVYEEEQDTTQTTIITALKAYAYDETDIFDLIGDVRIVDSGGNTFLGDQLYWDQRSRWILTDRDYTLYLKNSKNRQEVGQKKAPAWMPVKAWIPFTCATQMINL